MKKVFSISIIALTFFAGSLSCKKSSSTPQSITKPQPKMQYYANDVLIICDASGDVTSGWINYPYINSKGFGAQRIGIHGVDKEDANSINFNLGLCANCTTVDIGKYPLSIMGGKDVDCKIKGFIYNSGYSTGSDYTINITLIQNELASGTFSGILNPSTSGVQTIGPILNITKGSFSNIPINIPLH